MTAVTTTAIVVGTGPRVVQNLGPDPLYVGHSDSSAAPLVAAASGVKLLVGQSISITETTTEISVVSAGTSDVRTLKFASGLYPV